MSEKAKMRLKMKDSGVATRRHGAAKMDSMTEGGRPGFC